MKTVSFSLDDETWRGIEALAKAAKMSRSEVVRAMYTRMRLEKKLEETQAQAAPQVRQQLGSQGALSEDDLARYTRI